MSVSDAIYINIFNTFMEDTHEFNQLLAKLRTEGKLELMAHYITLIARSEGFGGYDQENLSVEGFKLDGTGVTKETLVQKGGILKSFKSCLSWQKATPLNLTELLNNKMMRDQTHKAGKGN